MSIRDRRWVMIHVNQATDAQIRRMNALGVIAIGVGGLEAESVMLGRASYMRLPDIVGVELTGKTIANASATTFDSSAEFLDIVAAGSTVTGMIRILGERSRSE